MPSASASLRMYRSSPAGVTGRRVPLAAAALACVTLVPAAAGAEPARAEPAPWEAGLVAARPWIDVVTGSAAAGSPAGWLEPVEGGQRLRAPWPADAMLRLRFPLAASGGIEFRSGTERAAFRFAGAAGWTSHRVVPAAGPAPLDELWESDDGLFWRFHPVDIEWRKFRGKIRDTRTVRPNATPLDFFWQDGEVRLWRGGLRLVSAPLPAAPDEVVIRFSAPPELVSMARITDHPSWPRHQPPAAVDAVKPGELAWLVAPPAAVARPDGRLAVSAAENAAATQATLPLTVPGVSDVVFVVERATNGSGVFLGGPDGRPLAGVQVVQGSGDSLAVSLANPWEAAPPPLDGEPAGRPLWVRLLPASGMLRCWQSRDGRHWALVGAKPMPAEVPVASCGVMAGAAGPKVRTITLARLIVRDYTGFNTLAPLEVRRRVPATPNPSVDAWRQWVAQTRPPEVPLPVWQRAAAVRSLGLGPPRPLANWLLRRLLEDAPRVARPVVENVGFLAEFPDLAALAWVAPWDGRPDEPITADVAAAAAALADVVQLDGESRPYQALGRQATALRMGPFPQLNYESPDAVVLPELVQLVAAGRLDEAERAARLVQCLGRDGSAAAVQWAIDAAAAVRRREPLAAAPHPGGWAKRPMEAPKAQVLHLADLEAACAAGNAARAAQLLADLEPTAGLDLCADPRDPRVGQTAAAAVARLLADSPAVAAGLKPAPAGKLRVRIAIAAGNAAGVLHAASQFAGTPAAAEAALWIGDQLATRGAAAAAARWYERGLATADLVQREKLSATLAAVQAAATTAAGEAVVPGPTAMRVEPLPDPAPDRPWAGRGLALAAAGDRIVAQDDRTLVALDGGKVAWQAAFEGGAATTPSVAGGAVIAAATGLRLQRFALADGQPRGQPVTIAGAEGLLSTPFVADLAARALVRGTSAEPTLSLGAAAFEAGPLPQLDCMPWMAAGGCPPLEVDDVLLAFVEGGIAGCEAIGPLRWFRRQDSISADSQAAAGPPVPTRSFAVGGDAVVWQPRVPYVERIEAASGRRVWSRPLPRIRRLIGVIRERVIVEAGRRLVGLDAGDGRIVWSVPLGELLPPAAVGVPGGILVARTAADTASPELVWIDPADGRLLGSARLDQLAGAGATLGPMLARTDRIVTFFQPAGGGPRLVQLVPAGGAGPVPPIVEGGAW